MSATPVNDEIDADQAADAMKAALQGDVASWSAARTEAAGQTAAEFRAPAPKRATVAKKAKVETQVQPVAPVAKKPFKMAYDGVTTAEHIQHMIDNGAR